MPSTLPPLRYRQIHLDFHTSEKIPGVGSQFRAEQFQEMLQLGHVDSVTLFSKCHHGMTYHDTAVGVRHPGMQDELLPAQIEACRAIDVKCPIYISAGLDEAMAQQHPGWLRQGKDGKTSNPLQPGFKGLSFSSPYLDYLCAQIEEVVQRFRPCDGIFLDIIHPHRDYSPWALREMLELGLDPQNDEDADAYAKIVLLKYFERTTAAAKSVDASTRVFHNSGHIPKGAYEYLSWNSHLELESLPTGGWGYDHFPLSAKYAATTGFDFLGMTGKFHTTWGEFGGFKRPNALRYECAAMLAFGSKCSVGDQLHPNGEMNRDTYELIGAAYSEVEAKEEWCRNAQAVSPIALVSPEAFHIEQLGEYRSKGQSEEGAARMLLELHQQFDVIDTERDLSQYELLILPDEITLDEAHPFTQKVQQFVRNGGKVLLSGRSGLNADGSEFVLDAGLEVVGPSQWNPDYIIPTELSPSPPVRGPFVIHGGALDVRAQDGTEVLAHRAQPYFNRTWDHFCSHQHTPDESSEEFPAATQKGNIIYFAHSIFKCYRELGQPLYRDLVEDALHRLLDRRVVETNLPTTGRVALNHQTAANRYVLHLLHAVPVKRGADSSSWGGGSTSVEVIEDLHPVHDVEVTLRLPQSITTARVVPSGEELELRHDSDEIALTIPKLECHAMIELNY